MATSPSPNVVTSRRAGPEAMPARSRRSAHSTPAAASSVNSTAARLPIDAWNEPGSSRLA